MVSWVKRRCQTATRGAAGKGCQTVASGSVDANTWRTRSAWVSNHFRSWIGSPLGAVGGAVCGAIPVVIPSETRWSTVPR